MKRPILGCAMFALLLAACGAPSATTTAGRRSVAPTALVTASPTPGAIPPLAGSSTPTVLPKAGGKPSPSGTGPSPAALPWTPAPDVPVEATLSPTCFQRGGLVTLKVRTKPKAGVAYIANYSDNGNGSPQPYGNGYGGNDKGLANGDGEYVSAFHVSPTAPAGPGRVDVIVGWDNKWGYAGPTFTVADGSGRC